MIYLSENKIVTFEEYLEEMLSPDDIEFLKMTKKLHAPVIITGEECTGKTTLTRILRDHGYKNVWEEVAIGKLYLTNHLPADKRIPNAYRCIL